MRSENPGDLPAQLLPKFELMINLKTANSLGLTVVAVILLATADEVIRVRRRFLLHR
jgi:ABC-type uncharacterized transport system substrate-binding protein